MRPIILILFLLLNYNSIAQENDYFIIKYKNTPISSSQKKTNQLNSKKLSSRPQYLINQNIILYKRTNAGDSIQNLLSDPNIEYIEKDVLQYGAGKMNFTPNDSKFNLQWGLKNNGDFKLSESKVGADIRIEKAWDIEKGSEEIIIAVIDTGCRIDHPELANRIWVNKQEIPNNNIDDDDNGYIDDIQGWDFHNNDNNPTDDHGHGTNVTGVIAANGDNQLGFSGVDHNCKVMILKGLDQENTGKTSSIIAAIYYAVDHGANVINLSLGGSHTNAYKEAINYAIANNVTIVASMMNNNDDIVKFPAGYKDVIAVGSTDPNDIRTAPFFWDPNSGSSYGEHISVVAPGNYIFSISNTLPESYNRYWGGTSQAAPHVTGIVSLLLAQSPHMGPLEIKKLIENTADDQVGLPTEDIPGFDIYYGHGRINALKALSKSLSAQELQYLNKNNSEIYPNPATNYINIDLGQEINLPTNISIYNTSGQIIKQKRLRERKNRIELIDIQNGLYFITIKNKTYKIIIQ